jgi:hypothetical protein
MRTQTIEGFQNDLPSRAAIAGSVRTLNRILCLAAKGFTALVPALAIVVGTAWAITLPGLEQFLQASIWASGFVFLALAIDSEKPTIGWLLATGIALPVLALLSSFVAGEFAIVAAVIVAAWMAASTLRL